MKKIIIPRELILDEFFVKNKIKLPELKSKLSVEKTFRNKKK